MPEAPHQPDSGSADAKLEGLGYKPELSRNRSTWQVMFMIVILASVPYGLATTMAYPMAGGGPANMIWGWVGVSMIMLCVGASLAEITSVYPTAGGVYYQTFVLSPRWCRRATAWICGWSYVAGTITITLAVNFATALFFVECLNIFQDASGVGITANFQPYQTYLVFLGITLIAHALPAFANRWLTYLETLSIFWTIAGVSALIITILVIADNGRRSAEWVFTGFEPQSGWPDGWSACIGLLQAAYALSATGMITSMCEEVHQPAVQVPKAIVGGVMLNFIVGLFFLVPIAFVLPDIKMLANLPSGQPVPVILKSAVGNSAGAFCLTIPLLIIALICGMGCVTSTSRCTWAFARDGAIPGSKWFRQVNPRFGIPFNAMLLSMTIQLLLGLIYFGSTAAFNAFSGAGVIFLTLSYACPVFASFILRRREVVKQGNFDLGRLGVFCNTVCLAWTLLAIPLFCMPSFKEVTLETMNYGSVVFVGFVTISAVWYWIWGHRNYIGPPSEEAATDPALAHIYPEQQTPLK